MSAPARKHGSGPGPARRPLVSREFLAEHRRRSFAVGASELADEFGVREVTVSMLCQVGHSARNTFYDLFSSAADCMRFTAAHGLGLLFAEAPGPGEGPPEPRAVTHSLCAAAAAEPALVRFCLVHSRSVPPETGEGPGTVESAIGRLAGLLAARQGADREVGPREDFVARIYVEMLGRVLLADDPDRVAALAEELGPWALGLLEAPG